MRLLVCLAITIGAIGFAAAPAAAYWRPNMQPVDDAGFAPEEQVAASVGNVSTEVVCPSRRFEDDAKRGARLTLGKMGAGWRDPGVLSTLLHDALVQVWDQCDTAMGSFGNSVGYVEIYAPTGEGGQTLVVRARNFIDIAQRWESVTDVVVQQEQAAVAQRQQAENERAQAEATAQAERDNQAAAERGRQNELAWERFWGAVWFGIRLVFWGGVALWLFLKREVIMRWYFFLTPHPAQSMVETAISTGVELDGQAFADILRPVPGGRIEKEVRAEQARKLAVRAQRYAEATRAEAERIRAEAQRDTEFITAQDELAKAATAHERAKARLEALRKRVG